MKNAFSIIGIILLLILLYYSYNNYKILKALTTVDNTTPMNAGDALSKIAESLRASKITTTKVHL